MVDTLLVYLIVKLTASKLLYQISMELNLQFHMICIEIYNLSYNVQKSNDLHYYESEIKTIMMFITFR